ncbi:DUF5302 domain-containing protein [Streptomyces sp. NPDC004830]
MAAIPEPNSDGNDGNDSNGGSNGNHGLDGDNRAKFREALARKANANQARQAHEDGRLRVKGMSGPAGQKRYFRRKTG